MLGRWFAWNFKINFSKKYNKEKYYNNKLSSAAVVLAIYWHFAFWVKISADNILKYFF